MKVISQCLGLCKKELILQSSSQLALLNRLFIGPVISLATTGILYCGFFKMNPSLRIQEMNGSDFLSFILFGFLVHTFLNSGYYFFSAKLLSEWNSKTLPLLLIAPCNIVVLFSGLYSMEALRCLIITFLGLIVLGLPEQDIFLRYGCIAGMLGLTGLLAICLGLLKSAISILNEGASELLDNFYLLFIFTGCPYIPKSLLPQIFHPIIELNPVYQACQWMRESWRGEIRISSLGLPFLFTLLCFIGLVYLGWQKYRNTIIENSI